MFQKLLVFSTAHRSHIIKTFQAGYLVLTLFAVFSAWSIASENDFLLFVFQTGNLFGKVAAILFLFITLPGILGRFGMKHPLVTIGIMFRRHLGILMFLLGFFHGFIVYQFPMLLAGDLFTFPPLFVVFGTVSICLLFPLFLTSNNYSVQKLGRNWKRLHKLVYIIFWTTVLHVGLQGERTITFAVAFIGILEIMSLLFDWNKKRSTPTTPPMPTPVQI